MIELLKSDIENDISSIKQRLNSLDCNESEKHKVNTYRKVLTDVYSVQRKELYVLRKQNAFNDSEIRKAEMLLNLNEISVGLN